MKGVPKIARRRLAVANEAGAQTNQFHPDATLLAAFAEKALAGRERSAVFDHLAQCADCRDVIFLAAPQSDAHLTPSKISASPAWLRLPILRWGVLGACALGVVAVALRYEGEKSPAGSPREVAAPMIAREIAPRVLEQRTDIRSPLATVAPGKPQHQALETNSSSPHVPRSRAYGQAASPVVPERHEARAVPKFPMQFDGPLASVQKLPAAERAPPSAVATLQSLTGGRLAKKENQVLDEEGKKAEQEPGQNDANLGELSEANSPASPVAVPPAMEQRNASGQSVSHLAALVSSPRWMLTSNGALQRSLDEGRTWQEVPLARGVGFRALSVRGAEIWVGGAAGALYHSSDLGQQWAQIVPNSSGESLKEEITRIEFTSPQQGALTTATGENWITSDSGRTWLKK